MPLVRRVPKRGFNNSFAATVAVVNVGELNAAFEAGAEVSPETLTAAQIIKVKFDELKILGDGELKKKLKVSAHRFSKSAAEKIAQAGGEAVVLPGPAPVVKNKMRKKQPTT
jgi:large subunit ribosomal protein L15